MAKGNMLLGQARGKVGDIVFSRNNGQQVVRARASVVKNPQTEAQIVQRILMNTIAQAYSKMLAIVDHSFEGVSVGQQTMSAFMSTNLNRLRRTVSAYQQQNGSLSGVYSMVPLGSKELAINPYVISVGSLNPIVPAAFGTDANSEDCVFLNIPGTPSELTYETFMEAFSLQRGDQVTFVQMTFDSVQGVMFGYNRIILDPLDNIGVSASLASPLFVDGEVNYPNDRNNGSFARVTYADGILKYSVGGGTPVGAAIIVSRQKTDGSWLRSNAAMFVTPDAALYGQYDLLSALQAFYSGGIDFASDYYLNNADNLSNSGGSGSTTSAATLTSCMIGGLSVLGRNTARIYNSATLAVAATVSGVDVDDTAYLLLTSRTLTAGSSATQEEGDVKFDLNNSSTQGSVVLTEGVNYRVYFAVGSVVKTVCGTVQYTSGSSTETVAAPTITPGTPSGGSNTFTISGPDGATIYYTTDGSTPSASSTQYSSAVTVNETTTVKAIAIKNGISSTVTQATVEVSTSSSDDGADHN